MECEHCHVILRSKYILKSHLLNSKTCLKLRGLSIQTKFICSGCDVMFMNNANLNIHTEACKKYILLKVNNEHKEEIEKLKEEIQNNLLKHKNELILITKENNKALADAHLQIDKLQKMISLGRLDSRVMELCSRRR